MFDTPGLDKFMEGRSTDGYYPLQQNRTRHYALGWHNLGIKRKWWPLWSCLLLSQEDAALPKSVLSTPISSSYPGAQVEAGLPDPPPTRGGGSPALGCRIPPLWGASPPPPDTDHLASRGFTGRKIRPMPGTVATWCFRSLHAPQVMLSHCRYAGMHWYLAKAVW